MSEKSEKIQVPFSPLEIFSIILPALVFFIGIIILFIFSKSFNKELIAIDNVAIIQKLVSDNTSGKDNSLIELPNMESGKYLPYIFVGIVGTVILLCMGHIIMALGSLIIDRLLIGQSIGYPYIRLLRVERSKWDKFSSRSYLTIFTLMFMYLVFLLYSKSYTIHTLVWRGYSVRDIFYAQIFFLTAIKIFASYVRRKYKSDLAILKSSSINGEMLGISWIRKYRVIIVNHIGRNVWKYEMAYLVVLGWFVAYLAEALIHLIQNLFRMEPFNDDVKNGTIRIFKEQFNIAENKIDSSIFWFPYIVLHEKNQPTAITLQYIRQLVYFARHLSISFGLLGLVCLYIVSNAPKEQITKDIGIVSVGISGLFFVHYYNIYYNYYSKQTLRSYYVNYVIKDKKLIV